MNQRTVLTILTVFAIASADATLVEIVHPDRETVGYFSLVALNFALVGVVAVWTVFDAGRAVARIGALVIVAASGSWCVDRMTGFSEPWRLIMFTQALTVVGSLHWLRRRGVRIIRDDAPSVLSEVGKCERRMQFSLAQVFGATAVAALLMTSLRPLDWNWPDIARCLLIGVLLAVPTWLGVWVVSGAAPYSKRVALAILLALTLVIPLSIIEGYAADLDLADFLELGSLFVVMEALTLAAFAGALRAGYLVSSSYREVANTTEESIPDSQPNDVTTK